MKSEEIKENRKKLNLTQEELGKLIGVSKRTIINYEKGEVIPDTKSEILHSIFYKEIDENTFLKKQIFSLQEENKRLLEMTAEKINNLQKKIDFYESLDSFDKRLKNIEDSFELLKMVFKVDSEIEKISKTKRITKKSS